MFFFLIFVFFCGCATLELHQRQDEVKNIVIPLEGKTRAQVEEKLGKPKFKVKKGNYIIYSYIKEYKVKDPDEKIKHSVIYDWFTLYFENNKVTKWESNVIK